MQAIAHEVHERIEKSKNIIIFNVEEELVDSTNSPMNLAETILKSLNLNISISHAVRLGKISSKPSPLLVKLGNKLEMLSVLKAKRKLSTVDKWKHIFIGADFTALQRTQYNNIKQQLDAKKRSGDNGCYIKFVKDIPTLVEKNVQK